MSAPLAPGLVQAFHVAYHTAGGRDGAATSTFKGCTWRGVRVHKCPFDLWTYQELIARVQPSVLIETGTLHGGSALFFADLLTLCGGGIVLSIDRAEVPFGPPRPWDHRIQYLRADSTQPETGALVAGIVRARGGPVLVSLDGPHDAASVQAELDLYSPLVTPGSYLVVEDTNLGGHPVWPDFGAGPAEALAAWLPAHPEFAPDPACERHWLTFNPGGWLRRGGAHADP